MKKWIAAILAAALLSGCGGKSSASAASASATASEATQVKISNSIVLNTYQVDMSGYEWLDDSDPAFVGVTLRESIRMFSEKGSGILYYGRENCPWCARAVPVLDQVAEQLGVTIYYVDVASTNEVTQADYNTLVGYIQSVFVTNSEGQKEFQIPEVLAVKNGEIVADHLSLVDSFTLENESSQMTDEQKAELAQIYTDLIKAAAD